MKKIILTVLLSVFSASLCLAGYPTASTSHFSPSVETNIRATAPKPKLKQQHKITKTKKLMGEKKKLVALLLCLFLGWLAIHRLYMGVGDGRKFLMIIGYILFNFIMVPIDFLVILFSPIERFLDNPSFISWF